MRRIQNKHLVLMSLNVAVWTMTALMWSGKLKLSAVKRVEVEIVTTPPRVRIQIDGSPYEGGSYLTTPATIRFLPGKHRITIQRTGYHSNSSLIVATMAEQLPPVHSVLEAITSNLQEVEIEAANGSDLSNIELTVDGGLEVGKLPLTINDLLPGVHFLEIKSGFITKTAVRCQFEVANPPSPQPLKITLEQIGRKLRINGCKRIKN